MKPRRNTRGEILDQSLGLYSNPSAGQIERAREHFLDRLESGEDITPNLRLSLAEEKPEFHSPGKRLWLAFAAAAAIAIAIFIPFALVQPPAATVNGSRQLRFGETVRSNTGAGTVLTLADGSRVEMRAESQLFLERANDGVRIRLSRGGIIVNAAKQGAGHLYVQTKDVKVSVVGTVFLVNTEETGSRVAVIEGEVQVQQGTLTKKLLPGQQVATNPLMVSPPVIEEIAWSRYAAAHAALLQQLTAAAPPAPAPAPPKRLEFEVASVKPDQRPTLDEPLRGTAVYCRGVDGNVAPFRLAGPSDIPQGRCIGRHVNLISLIAIAYDMKVVNPGLGVKGGPDWVRDAWGSGFQIEAKAEDAANATKDQLRQMLQALAEDKFKLRILRETRDVDGYAIVVGKGGPKLQETSGEEGLTRVPKRTAEKIEVSVTGKASMKTFVESFTFAFPLPDRRFMDKTGLTGLYAINLAYGFALPPPGEGGQRGGSGGGDPGAPAIAALAAALQEQLGLRLEPAKIPADFIVIEHAEKPEN